MIALVVALLAASDCQSCHQRQYSEWRGSRHAAAFSNAIFAASYAREPMRWCLQCHAPLPEQIAAVGQARRVDAVRSPLVTEGVNCAACHVQEGRVLSARELAAPDFCARCHQFNFPGSDEPMQDTLAEWRRSGVRQRCQDCHMPEGAHRFPGAHDLAFLKSAIKVEVTSTANGASVTLRVPGAAHRVPTGDPFRRLYVELCDEPSCEEPLGSPSFGRGFTQKNGGWRLDRDSSLPPGADEVVREVSLPRPARHWRLMYGYAAASTAPSLSADDWAAELARGQIARR